MNSKPEEEPLNVIEAAALLGMNQSTLYKTIKRGEITGWYVGKDKTGIRIDRAELRKYKKKYSTKKSKAK